MTLWRLLREQGQGQGSRESPTSGSTGSLRAGHGNSTGTGSVLPAQTSKAALVPCGARPGSWGKARVPQHGHKQGDARGSCCCWWERRAVGSTGSAAGSRGLLAARDLNSMWVLCPACICPQAPFTLRAPVRTKNVEKTMWTSSIPASCPSHEAVCHHRHCRKGKEQPPQPLPTHLLMAALMQAATGSGTLAGAGRLPGSLLVGRQQPCLGQRLAGCVGTLARLQISIREVLAGPAARFGGAGRSRVWTLPSSIPPASRVEASQRESTTTAGQGRDTTAAAMGCTKVAKVAGEPRSRGTRGHLAATVAASHLGAQRSRHGTEGMRERRAGPGVWTASDALLARGAREERGRGEAGWEGVSILCG